MVGSTTVPGRGWLVRRAGWLVFRAGLGSTIPHERLGRVEQRQPVEKNSECHGVVGVQEGAVGVGRGHGEGRGVEEAMWGRAVGGEQA